MSNKKMMQQAQQLQEQLLKAQQKLAEKVIEVSSGGGAVTVTINGQQEIQSIKISPDVVNPDDVEILEDLVLAALNEAMTKSQEMASQQLGALTGGFKIPGLM
jgi:DNA-binding YbaB/EbfC family protein